MPDPQMECSGIRIDVLSLTLAPRGRFRSSAVLASSETTLMRGFSKRQAMGEAALARLALQPLGASRAGVIGAVTLSDAQCGPRSAIGTAGRLCASESRGSERYLVSRFELRRLTSRHEPQDCNNRPSAWAHIYAHAAVR